MVGQFALGAVGQPSLIDATTVVPVPDDPDDEAYENSVLFVYPFLSGVKTVLERSLNGGMPRSFILSVSEYVCGTSWTFSIR